MAIDKKAYALANSYTDETVIGGGAIKGKNCTISKIEDIDGGRRITFNWTLDNGTTKSQTLDVKDGKDGYTPVKGVDYFDGEKGERGIAGFDGKDGKDGKDGVTYTPSIGTVTTVDSTELASATVSVNEETKEAVFNFAIPKGKDGDRNADTVNNHTVKSDVPENAVFTDTIYDDTEIKNSITEINSNLENCFLNTGIIISNESDIKSVDDAPIGICFVSKDAVNNPFTFWSTIFTVGYNNNKYEQQLAFPWAKNEATMMKFRVKDNGVWNDWKTISLS